MCIRDRSDGFAGTLGQLNDIAVAVQAYHLQQQHLQLIGIKAQSTYSSLHAGNITVVVSAPQVDDAVKAALEFVAVICNIGSKVGGNAVVTNNDAVLVIAVSG